MKSGSPEIHGAPSFFSTEVRTARRFYLDLNPENPAGLTVVCGGAERCVPAYRVQRDDFPYFSIEFIAHGAGSLILGGREFALVPGSVFSYGPGVAHRIGTEPGSPLVKYFVDFLGGGAKRFLRQSSLPLGTCIRVSAPGEIRSAFDELIRNGLSQSPLGGPICAILLRYLALKIAEAALPSGSSGSRSFETYERCRRFIEERFLEVRTLEEVARGCSVDKTYLCRIFKKFDHQSPYQKLLRLQMGHAMERLRQSGQLVKQIAGELGWEPFHFSRVFKKVCGVSPESFVRLAGRRG